MAKIHLKLLLWVRDELFFKPAALPSFEFRWILVIIFGHITPPLHAALMNVESSRKSSSFN